MSHAAACAASASRQPCTDHHLCPAALRCAALRCAAGVDHEVAVLFHVSNENRSPYLPDNIAAAEADIGGPVNTTAEDFEESNLMHGINGCATGCCSAGLPGRPPRRPPLMVTACCLPAPVQWHA